MLVDDDLGAAQPRAVDDAGVVQPVGEDDVLLADQRRQRGLVGDEAALDVERILHAFECRHRAFQFLVQRERPGDGAHRRRPRAETVDGGLGGVRQTLVVGEAQVIVGARG